MHRISNFGLIPSQHNDKVSRALRIDALLKERGITGAKMSTDLGMSRSFMTELRKGRAQGRNRRHCGAHCKVSRRNQPTNLLGEDTNSRFNDPVERELAGYLEELRARPDKRMLFSVTKNATKEQIEAIVHMIEELQASK